MIPFGLGIFCFRYVYFGTAINFAYVGLLRIAWYVPENPTTSKVRLSVRKFHTSPNVTGRSICPMESTSISGTTSWNGAVDGLGADRRMPMPSSVDT
jgi:hypothetical protein